MLERFWRKVITRKGLSWLSLPALVLWPVSAVYRIGFLFRKSSETDTVKVSVPVISVGNLTVGGSGKTPMVGFIVRSLLQEGIRVGIVSSGYGRSENVSLLEPGYKLQGLPVSQTGDEIMTLANDVPTAWFAVSDVKAEAAGRLADSGNVDVIVVDDGFQHFQLARDVNLLTYDAAIDRRLLKLFPVGVLREPISAMRRADTVVITRSNFAKDIQRLERRLKKIHPGAEYYTAKFRASHVFRGDQVLPLKYLEDKSVFLFAGVGNFEALRRQVSALTGDVDFALELGDHQVYDAELLQEIKELAEEHEADLLLTTFKDRVKLGNFDFGRELCLIDLTIDLDPGEEKFIRDLMEKLKLTPGKT